MNHGDRELEQAWEELTFWRGYEAWWRSEYGNKPEPRILEAVEWAKKRYTRAALRRKINLLL